MNVDFTEFSRRMDKTLDHLAEEFGAVRAGRANAKVLPTWLLLQPNTFFSACS